MRTVLAVLVLAQASWALSAEAAKDARLGTQISDFELRDFRGKQTSFAELSDGRITVVAFLGVDCPLARQYAGRLSEMAAEYAERGVTFVAIDSNQQDSATEMASFAERYHLSIPFLRDQGNVVADQFKAERTPQVFVVDAGGIVRYAGRIDDQFGFQTGTGYAKPRMHRRDLGLALDEVLAGKEVSEPITPVKGCLIGRLREVDENASVTYSNQVARVLNKHCVECHRAGQIAPFPLQTYDDVAGWAEMIGEVVDQQRMPPWSADPAFGHWRNDRSMNAEERQLIADWVSAGAPEGNRADLPEAPQFASGWEVQNPDEVFYMSDEPYTVQAEGVIDYQYFVVDPGYTEDKWIKTVEARPGERSVVHHIIVFIQKPGTALSTDRGRGEAQDMELLHGTAPGLPRLSLPEGMAMYVPAGSKFVFQMHYTATGTETKDRSSVAVVYADPAEVKQAVRTENATNAGFEIPAHADSHPVNSKFKFQRDTLLVWLMPHMHLRGKDFRYDLRYPDGTVETILNVPRYDFNWQLVYEFAEPKRVPAGTVLECFAHFDNSDNNLANPDPTKPVRWGDQTWEEMMIGWFGMSTDILPGTPGESRTAVFQRAAAAEPLEINSRVKRFAKRALGSEKSFGLLKDSLMSWLPQIDRVCVSVVDGQSLNFPMVGQSPVLALHLDKSGASRPAEGTQLCEAASGKTPLVLASLKESTAADMAGMSQHFGSSLHVPVTVGGKPATVNFWSREQAAFPPEAEKFLSEVVAQMTEGR